MILETPRLLLREMNAEDAESIYLLNADPEVIKYTGDLAFPSINSAQIFLENYDHYKQYGFGRWAVIRKENAEFIGWCGLKYTPDLDEHDIGFRFFKKHWNQGYATEAANACINWGFKKLGLQRIVGRAMKENLASIRVLQKIGLQFSEDRNCGGKAGSVFVIEKDDYYK